GGIYFWTSFEQQSSGSLRDRIYKETMRSITLAQELRGRLKEALGDEFFWDDQVHIDVGEHGPTKDLIDAVVGMVKGYGFDAVIKPYAFGASVVADRHT
ncbi:MAG TPA: ribonuclease H-like YkuK family protein, partial [Candidatus Paceibacterota bacterium]